MAVTAIDGGKQIRDNTVTAAKVTNTVIIAAGTNAFTGDQSLGGFKLTSVGNPATGTDAVNKNYVDGLIAGLKWKQSVKAATTTNGTLATAFDDGSVIDGITLATGDRILVKDQSDGTENGIYIVAASGAPTRATDADAGAELVNAAVFVEQGTANADKAFVATNNAITLGSTAITFTTFASVVGALLAANNLSDLASASTARTNLGATTVGGNIFTVANPSAIRFLRVNADNTVTLLTASDFRTAIGATGGTAVTRETPTGTINGSNTDFTLANTPVAGSESVYLNGILQDAGGGNDYTIAGAVITFLTAPISGDKIRVNYTY